MLLERGNRQAVDIYSRSEDLHPSWDDHQLESKLYLAPQKIPVFFSLVCMAKQLMRKKVKGLTVSWGTSHMASPASQGRWLSHSALYRCDFTSGSVCRSVWHSLRRTAKGVQRKANKMCKVSRERIMRIIWFVHLEEEKKAEGWIYSSYDLLLGGQQSRRCWAPLWWSGIEHKEMEWSYISESSNWTLGKGFPLRGWLVSWTGFSGMWSWHQICQSSRNTWMMLLVIWLNFRSSCQKKGVGHNDPCVSFLPWNVLILWLDFQQFWILIFLGNKSYFLFHLDEQVQFPTTRQMDNLFW